MRSATADVAAVVIRSAISPISVLRAESSGASRGNLMSMTASTLPEVIHEIGPSCVDIYCRWSMLTPSIRSRACHRIELGICGKLHAYAHHASPLAILEVLLSRTPYTLRFVQAEETIIELPDDVLRRKEVIAQPLLPEFPYVCAEDGSSKWAEAGWLIHRDKEIFQLERLEFKIALLRDVAEGSRIERVLRVPSYEPSVWWDIH